MRNNKLSAEEGKKEWEHYVNYIKSLDNVLKKKGLRYGKYEWPKLSVKFNHF